MVAIGILFAFYAYASSNNLLKSSPTELVYFDETYKQEENVLYKPSEEIVEKLAKEYERAQAIARLKAKNHVGYWESQCVTYAKQLTGVYGTWGNGGRYLSGNSGPVVGAVIIFTYTHVGVITAVDGNTITYTDRNFDLHGGIRPAVTIQIGDPSISRFHLF